MLVFMETESTSQIMPHTRKLMLTLDKTEPVLDSFFCALLLLVITALRSHSSLRNLQKERTEDLTTQ
jgi:hypothetical protein